MKVNIQKVLDDLKVHSVTETTSSSIGLNFINEVINAKQGCITISKLYYPKQESKRDAFASDYFKRIIFDTIKSNCSQITPNDVANFYRLIHEVKLDAILFRENAAGVINIPVNATDDIIAAIDDRQNEIYATMHARADQYELATQSMEEILLCLSAFCKHPKALLKWEKSLLQEISKVREISNVSDRIKATAITNTLTKLTQDFMSECGYCDAKKVQDYKDTVIELLVKSPEARNLNSHLTWQNIIKCALMVPTIVGAAILVGHAVKSLYTKGYVEPFFKPAGAKILDKVKDNAIKGLTEIPTIKPR